MKTIFSLLCMAYSLCSLAQEHVPILKFSSKDYAAQNQNWAISQSESNFVYVANNGGLLEFDGAKWRLFKLQDESIVRTVKVIDNKIYTGSFMDFGVWEKDSLGDLNYTSLVDEIDIEIKEDEQFWNIEEIDGWLLFQSLSRIYLINLRNNSYKVIDSEVSIPKIFKVHNDIYFQKINKGIYKIENGVELLVNNSKIVKDNIIVNIIQTKKGLLYITEDNGFYIYGDDIFKRWHIETEIGIKNLNIYRAIQLKNKTIALGTISNGIIIINPNGTLSDVINHKTGLSNNTVLSIYEDKQNDLWVGLDNGINCINLSSRYRLYTDNQGEIGTVYASVLHENFLYLGTNQGLYYKERHKNENFSLIEGTKGQVWTLKVINGELFCGHNDGTFVIEKRKILNHIDNIDGTWDFKPLENNPNLILQGNYKGLSVLEKKNNNWQYRNKLKGFDISSRFYDLYKNQIFVNHEFKGLYTLSISNQLNEIKSVKAISTIEIEKGSSLFKFSNNYYYTNLKGVYKLSDSNQFQLDTEFTALFNDYTSLSTLLEIKGESNKLWRYADDKILIVSPSNISTQPQVEVIPFSSEMTNAVAGFQNLTKINENEYLIGTSNGYIILNKSKEVFKSNYEIQINSIQVHKIDHPKEKKILKEKGNFKNKWNNIELSYSVPNYKKITKNKYQYQLLGLSDNWSDWEEESTQLFENLPFGSYTFNVRGKIGDEELTTNVASYSFNIARPWFLSNLSIILYVIGIIGIFTSLHSAYDRYYKKQKQELILKAQKELELKEIEKEQERIKFKNETLQQEIKNKNRELAVSTMSMIKKNEFLSSIKNDLASANNMSSIQRVLKIIDKNLNNEDDWEFFKKAFNNADKEFFSKLKEKHPSLTPNDLKICAYLRLNLSSKEIAPLLNISIKSVEVKRYRLRKKMNLPHEANLNNYIISI